MEIAPPAANATSGLGGNEQRGTVPGFDSDVMVTSRFLDPLGTPPHLTTARQEATVLHRGPALWLAFREDRGAFAADFEAAPVDVRAEMCQVMGLCYRTN